MISFLLCLTFLIVGYFVYSKIVERVFGVDFSRETCAVTKQDGVDFMPMKPWRIFMIQFLNIAGLGPIFGAIMGAKFGTASFLWIVIGTVFAGGVHDYISGMISLRNDGISLPDIHGKYLGKKVSQVMRIFSIGLLILAAVVFIVGPAALLTNLTHNFVSKNIWIAVILIYYLIATLLPIDKVIGKIYPIFGVCFLIMAIGILSGILINHPHIPEFWEGMSNQNADVSVLPIFPMMFISIACGAISGFHATQSPMMARCMVNEKQGRPIFYGAMVVEGIVALVWAAAATYFFFDTPEGQVAFSTNAEASVVVDAITKSWLGTVGAILAVIGVVVAPITTGDTALRSARLILADLFKVNQKPIVKRLYIAIPLFIVVYAVLMFCIYNASGFDTIWRYFAWANQLLAMVTLWAVTVYLAMEKRCYWIAFIPAIFMTIVCSCYILFSPKEGFGLSPVISYSISALVAVIFSVIFFVWKKRFSRMENKTLQ